VSSAGADIRRIRALGTELAPLVSAADREGHAFVRRLREEWDSGANRFDRAGEALFGAFAGKRLVGVGGLNRDPFANADGVGRLRHLYIAPEMRRSGVGRLLVERIVTEAKTGFSVVRLRTLSADAAAFYRRLGFVEVDEEAATHVMRIGRVASYL
jgi:N-acetylglutamate synthase-like GNAT family acetyltransferase